MRTERIDYLNRFLDKHYTISQKRPESVFTLRLQGLLWSLIILENTYIPSTKIKAGLLNHLYSHSDEFSLPNQRTEKRIGIISEPTRIKYTEMTKQGRGEYNITTFYKLMEIATCGRFRKGFDVSLFWETFSTELLLELYTMLPNKPNSQADGIKPFWIAKIKDSDPMTMVNLNLHRFFTVFGTSLFRLGKNVFTQSGSIFDMVKFLNSIEKWIEKTLCDSSVELFSNVRSIRFDPK